MTVPAPSLSARQQMLSSGMGAITVSLLMTPLDVVKIRLQSQERLFAKKCFLYSNGLMDHLCPRSRSELLDYTLLGVCKCSNKPYCLI